MINLIKILLVLVIIEQIINIVGDSCNLIKYVARNIYENKHEKLLKSSNINEVDNSDLKQFLFIRSEK